MCQIWRIVIKDLSMLTHHCNMNDDRQLRNYFELVFQFLFVAIQWLEDNLKWNLFNKRFLNTLNHGHGRATVKATMSGSWVLRFIQLFITITVAEVKFQGIASRTFVQNETMWLNNWQNLTVDYTLDWFTCILYIHPNSVVWSSWFCTCKLYPLNVW